MKQKKLKIKHNIIDYIFDTYEQSVISDICINCHFFKNLYIKYFPISNTPYLKVNKKKIHIDNIKKNCYMCVLYCNIKELNYEKI